MNSSMKKDDNYLKNVCRACMSSEGLIMQSLFSGDIADMYMTCTMLKVSDLDLLPHKICIECLKLLESLHNFRLKCHTSEARFITYLQQHELKKISTFTGIENSPSETEQCFKIVSEEHIEESDFDMIEDYEEPNLSNPDNLSHKEAKIVKHLKVHKNKKDKSRKKNHLKTVKSKRIINDIKEECKLCKKTFAYLGSWQKHKVSCGKIDLGIKNAIDCRENEKQITISPFVCGLCPEEYQKQELLNAHLENHKQEGTFLCKVCKYRGLDWADFLSHRYSHQPVGCKVDVKCWACTSRFSIVERLEFHVRREHLGKRPGLCKVCHKEFSSVNNLRAHKFIHSGDKPRKCKICGKSFVYRRSLALHMRCHSDVKKYVCHTCGNAFKFSTGLISHQFRMHSEVQMMICNHCGKSYKNRETLRQHLLRITSVKNFECLQCNKRFRSQKELDYHAKWHSDLKPFQCSECGKGYKSNSHLISHMRQHTGERPYQCDLCTKSFMTSNVLKKHRMIHTGEKPHACELCGKAFVEKSNLKNHMKTHK